MVTIGRNKDEKIRRYILITLSHSEKRNVAKEEICQRIQKIFVCRSVIVAQEKHQALEKHQELGTHFHIGVLNDSASRNNATSIIRGVFPEFEGRQCDITFHKGWNTICAYVCKEDENPLVWGEYSLEQIRRVALQVRKKVKNIQVPQPELINQLRKCQEWVDVYDQPDLVNLLLLRYNNMKKIHEDLQNIQLTKSSFAERVVDYLHRKGWPQEYEPEEIKEKYILLDWIACQLICNRPIKTKQLFIYGAPSTQKTLILHFLSKALRIYFVGSRSNDFTEADNYYDLWVFDEFYDFTESGEQTYQNQNEDYQAHNLLKVLDGQECRLDSKYGKIFKKNRNVPILMIANRLTQRVKKPGPMRERFLRLRFHSKILNLQEERIIATFWGCVERRINQVISPKYHADISLKYNSVLTLIRLSLETIFPIQDEEENPLQQKTKRVTCACTQENEYLGGTLMIGNHLEKEYPYFLLLQFESFLLQSRNFSLIQFAFIPIKKKKEGNLEASYKNFTTVFKNQKEGTTFQILRNRTGNDFIVWPAYATPIQTKKPLEWKPFEEDPWPFYKKNDKENLTQEEEINEMNKLLAFDFESTTHETKRNGKEIEWPVKLLLAHGIDAVELLNSAVLQEKQQPPTSYPKPWGFWEIHLGVPTEVYQGNWDEND